LTSTGQIEAWGDNTTGEVSDAPKGNGFTAISAGYGFGLALTSTGQIEAWGFDSQFNNFLVRYVPKDKGFKAISAGNRVGLALSANPEPNSLVMAGTALLAGLIAAWCRRPRNG
jgi:hypothetical protein